MTSDKLTRKQIAKLGGLTVAHQAGADGMARIGHVGGNATLEKHGRAHFSRAAHARWGRLKARKAGSANAADSSRGAAQEEETHACAFRPT